MQSPSEHQPACLCMASICLFVVSHWKNSGALFLPIVYMLFLYPYLLERTELKSLEDISICPLKMRCLCWEMILYRSSKERSHPFDLSRILKYRTFGLREYPNMRTSPQKLAFQLYNVAFDHVSRVEERQHRVEENCMVRERVLS